MKVYLCGSRPKTEAQYLGLNYIKRLKHLFCFVQVKTSLHLSLSSVFLLLACKRFVFLHKPGMVWLGSIIMAMCLGV